MNGLTAIVAGGSGLIGGHCLRTLLADDRYAQVIALVRMPLAVHHPKLTQRTVDFDRLEQVSEFLHADDLFCCLGTTIRNAGSQEEFRKVDFHFPLQLARRASSSNVKQFLMVTSLGADPTSSVFYNRVKGEVEQEVVKLPFISIHFFRPSLLLGNRTEFRLGERIGAMMMGILEFLMVGKWRRYRAIKASVVAHGMVHAARLSLPGVHYHESNVIESMIETNGAESLK